MTSEELNKKISDYDNEDSVYQSCLGNKVVPYIGWYWRDVNFDAESCSLGILPIFKTMFKSNAKSCVGFMENNKWGYDEFVIKGKQWKKLRELLENAVTEATRENFKKVDKYMQSLLPKENKKEKE